jgi:DNA polymerase III epsilon subunit-like protein
MILYSTLQVYKKTGLSPGKNYIKYAAKKASIRARERIRQGKTTFKRRRLELKSTRCAKDTSQHLQEGDTYESEILNTVENPQESILPCDVGGKDIVFWDLETTGLERNANIIQIASICGEEKFARYIMPTKNISEGARQATQLDVRGGRLCYRGEPVETVSLFDALTAFIDFLRKFNKPILTGHNIAAYDVHVLLNAMRPLKLLGEILVSISGCIDTMTVSKKMIPKSELKVKSYRQQNLIEQFLGVEYDAHNAIEDVKCLQELYNKKLNLCVDDISKYLFPLNRAHVAQSLSPLVVNKVISEQTRKKLAQSFLGLQQLKETYTRDTVDGIATVFKEPVGSAKTPRITKSKKIIQSVCTYLGGITD